MNNDILSMVVRVGDDGPVVKVNGRDAWALAELIEAGTAGLTTLERPAPRWRHYIYKSRKAGIAIETIHEAHADRTAAVMRGTSCARPSLSSRRSGHEQAQGHLRISAEQQRTGDCCSRPLPRLRHLRCEVLVPGPAGELKPGKTGISLSLKHLPDLAEGLQKALVEARQLGLIEEPSDAGR